MARRRRGVRSKVIGFDLNKMSHEVRRYLLDAGMEVVEELARRVAQEANELATESEEEFYTEPIRKSKNQGIRKKFPRRRGPNKYGGSDSGPIKGSIFAQASQKVPYSYLVVCPAWYSHFVEYGTDPHFMPRKSKLGKTLMVFPGTNEFIGQTIATKNVNHTGAKKRPFLRPAADKAEQFARDILREKGFM